MLLFGHLGITLGAALVCREVYNWGRRGMRDARQEENSKSETLNPKQISNQKLQIRNQKTIFDPRFWILGSILPDLIDKPLGHFIFSQYFGGNGRLYAHSLLFLILIMAIGLYLYTQKKKGWLLALGFGVLMHLILDYSWQSPVTLFWPLLGIAFPAESPGDWISGMLKEMVTVPSVYIPEIIGFIVLAWFGVRLLVRKGVVRFLKNGEY
jgi:inner membrane protein